MLSLIICAIAAVVIGRGFGKRFDAPSAVVLALPFGAVMGGAVNMMIAALLTGAGFGSILQGAALSGGIVGGLAAPYAAFLAYLRRRNRVSE